MADEREFMLGEISANMASLKEGQDKMLGKLDSFEERVRAVEMRSATFGTLGGGIMAIAVALIQAKFGK